MITRQAYASFLMTRQIYGSIRSLSALVFEQNIYRIGVILANLCFYCRQAYASILHKARLCFLDLSQNIHSTLSVQPAKSSPLKVNVLGMVNKRYKCGNRIVVIGNNRGIRKPKILPHTVKSRHVRFKTCLGSVRCCFPCL